MIVILGILLSQTVMQMDGITPEYRLRSAAREIGSRINWTRSLAAGAGKEYVLHYEITERMVWVILPPAKDEDPDQPFDQRERHPAYDLPQSVEIEKIIQPDGVEISEGPVDIVFDALGNSGTHIIYLRNTEGTLISLKFNALLGMVDFYSTEIEFERF